MRLPNGLGYLARSLLTNMIRVAISLTICRGHLGLLAQSPKKNLERGSRALSAPGAQKVRKESKTELKT